MRRRGVTCAHRNEGRCYVVVRLGCWDDSEVEEVQTITGEVWVVCA
jgi:hypothetical protein